MGAWDDIGIWPYMWACGCCCCCIGFAPYEAIMCCTAGGGTDMIGGGAVIVDTIVWVIERCWLSAKSAAD